MRPSKSSRETGQSILLFALVLVGILAIASLTIEGGRIFVDRRNAQSAADAAAMSGAVAKCKGNNVITAARDMATSNGYLHNGTTIVVAVDNPPIDGLHIGDSKYVKVKITSTVNTLFAKAAKINIPQVAQQVSAVSLCAAGGGVADGYGLMTLNKTGKESLNRVGGGYIWVEDGGIFVNSSNSQAVGAGGVNTAINTPDGEIWADAFDIVGDYNSGYGVCVGSNVNNAGCPAPNTSAVQISDPFPALVPPPKPGGACLDGKTSGSRTYNPGKYCTIDISGSGTIIFNPGIYWIENPSSKLTAFAYTGSGSLTANGVMFYVADGAFDMAGSGTQNFSGPTSGDYQGMALYMDKTNTSKLTVTGSGGATSLQGTFYAPASAARFSGSTGTIFNAQIICDTYNMTGVSVLHIQYDGSVLYGGGGMNISLVE